MKFYGIDAQGYIKIQQTTGDTPPAFSPGDDERRIIYVHDTANLEDEIYIGGDQANNWTRVVLDDGASYPTLQADLGGSFHPLNGATDEPLQTSMLSGPNSHNAVPVEEDWVIVSAGTPADTAAKWAGFAVDLTPAYTSGVNSTTDAYIFYDGIRGADPSGWGWTWRVSGPTYTGVQQTIATREWVDDLYLLQADALTTDTASLTNYYTSGVSDGRFVKLDDYYSDVVLNSPTAREAGWTTPEAQQYFASYEYTGTEDGVSITGLAQYSVVARNSSGDIKARIGNLQATSAQYADLAEKYTCDMGTPIGTVMEVSSGTEYETVPCAFELSPVVVGVVSENPAHLMNSESAGLPIALTGRVPVRVIGGVNKGDFIVPAGNGQARKGEASELAFKMGMALESSLQTTEKLVECIIK